MEHLFPAPDMKRGTHVHEANSSARASHKLPGPLTLKATNVVICSSFHARGRCPYILSPSPPDLRAHGSCLESYYTHHFLVPRGLSEVARQLAGGTKLTTGWGTRRVSRTLLEFWPCVAELMTCPIYFRQISFIKHELQSRNQCCLGGCSSGLLFCSQVCRPRTPVWHIPPLSDLEILNYTNVHVMLCWEALLASYADAAICVLCDQMILQPQCAQNLKIWNQYNLHIGKWQEPEGRQKPWMASASTILGDQIKH